MPRTVAIVFAEDYSGDLERLSFHTPVWIADTPSNHAAAEDAWLTAVDWPHISVTLFRPPHGYPNKDDWAALLEQIGLREKFDAVDVIGTPLTPVARNALSGTGFDRFDETPTGFRARPG